jgi:hypothetical protein
MNLDDLNMHLEVGQALARYSHGVDHGDLELAKSAYWPEATDHHGGMWDGNGIEFVTQLIAGHQESRASGHPAVGPLHHLTTTLVRRTGADEAKVQTYFIVCGAHEMGGDEHLGLVVGRYLDRFERRGDEWRIIDRVVVNDYTRHDVPGDVWAVASWQAGGFPGGGYGRSDPGVQFFASR